MLAYVKSDIGLLRETKEDSYAFVPPHLFVVADGMGGHVAGEVASKLAISTVCEFVEKNVGTVSPEELLEQAINQANTLIYQMSQYKEECAGMGTTVTAAYIDGDTIYWGHVGDSRMYLLNNQEFRQLTNDHSLVWELVQSGTITKEEALSHPQRNMLTRAAGTSCLIKIDSGMTTWEPGNTLLICTDGLTNMVSEPNIFQLLNNRSGNGEFILDQLIEQAKNAGGFDNITAILAQYEDA